MASVESFRARDRETERARRRHLPRDWGASSTNPTTDIPTVLQVPPEIAHTFALAGLSLAALRSWLKQKLRSVR